MTFTVELDPKDLQEKTTDRRGRFTLGSGYANQEVKILVVGTREQERGAMDISDETLDKFEQYRQTPKGNVEPSPDLFLNVLLDGYNMTEGETPDTELLNDG